MEIRTLQPNKEDAGTRVDAWLAANLEDLTRSAAARLLEEGSVTCGGKALAKNYKLTGAETISVCLPDPEPVDVVPQDIPLDVVYEDDDVIVVNKPKGLVVHPAPGHPDGTLVNALLYHCGDSLSGIGGELRPGIVHRIDRDTSGLIIAAKNDMAHQKLAAQLQDHTLARVYRCIVTGNLREDAGTVDAPIGRHGADRKKMAVTANGRNAVTHWRVLERFPGFTYVSAGWRPGGPTRSVFTWPTSAIPFWETPCTGTRSPCRGSRASASMPWACGLSIPAPEKWWSLGARCRRSLKTSCGSWKIGAESGCESAQKGQDCGSRWGRAVLLFYQKW